jgi:Kiwa protein KwaB-like
MTTVSESTPDVETEFGRLLDLDVSTCSVNVCVGSYRSDDDVPEFQLLQLSSSLSQEFRDVVAGALQRLRQGRRAQDVVLRSYTDASKPDLHEIEFVDLATQEKIRQQFEALVTLPLSSLPVFSADDAFVTGMRFYVIILQPRSRPPVYFFRTYTPKRELRRSTFFAALFAQGQFDTIKEPTFLFDKKVDCISIGHYMFVLQKANFHTIFHFFEMVLKAASATLEVIQTRIPIKNFEQFAQDCQGHVYKLFKLKNIAGRSYLTTINIEDLRNVINRLALPIPIETVDGVEMLVYDRSDRWALLRLLDDDYVQSLLTSAYYEASGKRPL